MYEKLTILPYGQYIVGNVFSLAFRRYSDIQDLSGGWRKICKKYNCVSNVLASSQQQAVMRGEVIMCILIATIARSAVGTNIEIHNRPTACRVKVKFKVSIWT